MDSPYFCPNCHMRPSGGKCGCFNTFGQEAQSGETKTHDISAVDMLQALIKHLEEDQTYRIRNTEVILVERDRYLDTLERIESGHDLSRSECAVLAAEAINPELSR